MPGAAAAALFPFGLVLGSFVTVVAHRIPRGQPFATGRSRCPGCGTQIAAYDNVPVLSWLLLRGHCRACHEPIPARYPLTELGLGALFAGTVLALGTGDAGQLAMGLVLCFVLVAITLTDLDRRVIPNKILAAAALSGLALAAATEPSGLPERLIAAAAAGGFLLAIAFAHPQGMGMGDVKLAAVMGLYLGSAVAPAMLVAFATGGLAGVAIMARSGASARKQAVPFGPFLALGGIAGLWFGDAIVSWYLTTFMGG
jgi:leader peptidase (prepilin peptidase)/N-methyltransferase